MTHPAQNVFRIEPRLPVAAVKTYQIEAPLDDGRDFWRLASCAEIGCKWYREGWASPIDERTEDGQQQAWAIRNRSGRRYTEDRGQAPGITVFTFEPGQKCFKWEEHLVRTGRPALFIVHGGDWRGNPTGLKLTHVNADDWVDDFANHQAALADLRKKG